METQMRFFERVAAVLVALSIQSCSNAILDGYNESKGQYPKVECNQPNETASNK